MKTIEDAYISELLQVYARQGEWEVLRRLNNLLADTLKCIDQETTDLDKVKRFIHEQLLTTQKGNGRKGP